MKNSEYWKQRFTQLEAAQNAIGENTKADIERIYREAQRTIEGQITAWYERLMKNNDISMAEAKKWLRGKELREFHWDVGDYIRYAKENAMNKAWIKELENASAKFHISRLEGLNVGLEHSLQKMFHKEESIMTDALSHVYKEGYYRTMYELQKGFSVGFDVAKIDDNYVHKVLSKPWAADGYNFSERIWKNKTQLINTVHQIISQNVLTGADPRKAINTIAAKMKTSKYNAGRLVMTEEAYFSSLATGDCFRELDVEKYEILATLDNRTSDICQSMDGRVFDTKDYQAGVTAPPFHVFCRSTTVPAFDKDYDIKGSRAARNEDGKTYYVDGDMRYSEWKAKFVDKTEEKPAPQEKSQDMPKTESKPQSVSKSQPKAENKTIQNDRISDINAMATETLKKNYEENRKHFNLNLTPAGEVKGEWVNLKKIPQKTAEQLNDVLSQLQSQYYSTLSEIKAVNLGKMSGAAAYVEPSGYAASSRMLLNADVINDKDFHIKIVRFNSTANNGKGSLAHGVEVIDGKETEYFVTHEFAHSVFTTRAKKELISIYGDKFASEIDKAQRKIKTLYKNYVGEIEELESKLSQVNKTLNRDFADDDFIELMSKQKSLINRIEEIKISKYAAENVDEFIAESFTQMRIGKNKSPYSKQTNELLDSVFKKSGKTIDKSGESGIIESRIEYTTKPNGKIMATRYIKGKQKITLPNGDVSIVHDPVYDNYGVFVGKGSDKELRVRDKLVENYGGKPENWFHAKGYTNVKDEHGVERRANVHWFEEETVGIPESKVKGWSKK